MQIAPTNVYDCACSHHISSFGVTTTDTYTYTGRVIVSHARTAYELKRPDDKIVELTFDNETDRNGPLAGYSARCAACVTYDITTSVGFDKTLYGFSIPDINPLVAFELLAGPVICAAYMDMKSKYIDSIGLNGQMIPFAKGGVPLFVGCYSALKLKLYFGSTLQEYPSVTLSMSKTPAENSVRVTYFETHNGTPLTLKVFNGTSQLEKSIGTHRNVVYKNEDLKQHIEHKRVYMLSSQYETIKDRPNLHLIANEFAVNLDDYEPSALVGVR